MKRLLILFTLALFALTSHAQNAASQKDSSKTPKASWRDRMAPISQPTGEVADLYGAVKDTAQVGANAVAANEHAKVLAKRLEDAKRLWQARKGFLKAEKTLLTKMSTGSKASRRQAQKQLQALRQKMTQMPDLPKQMPDMKWANRMEQLGKLGDIASNVEAFRTEGSWGVFKDRTHDMFQGATATFGGLKGAEAGAALALGLGLGGPATVVVLTVGTATGTLIGAAGYEYHAKPIVDENLDEVGGKAAKGLGTAIKAGARASGSLGQPAQLTPEAEKWAAEQASQARQEAARKRAAEAAAEKAKKKEPKPAGDSDNPEVPTKAPKGNDSDDDESETGNDEGRNQDKGKGKNRDSNGDGDSAENSDENPEDNNEEEDKNGNADEQDGDPVPPGNANGDQPSTSATCNPEVPGPCFNQRHDWSGEDRDLWEGLNGDPGNLDAGRLGNRPHDRPALPDNWRPGDTNSQATQHRPQPGEVIGDSYTLDPILEAERDRALAEQQERIVSAANPRRGRGRGDGDSIAHQFGSAPDTDQLGNNEDDHSRPGNDRQPEGEKPPRTDSQPPASEQLPEAPKPPPAAGKPGKPDTPQAPEKPAYDEAYCLSIVNKVKQKIPGMMSTLQRMQRAAAAKDEALAHQLGCQYMADSSDVMSMFEAMNKAKCPLQGDTKALGSQISSARTSIQNSLVRDCGATTSYTHFAGTWRSAGTCPSPGIAGNRWVIDLSQTDEDIRGTIAFHLCPGGGRASYAVTGTANNSDTVQLRGVLRSSRGPLAESARQSITFSVRKNAPPSPNLAQ